MQSEIISLSKALRKAQIEFEPLQKVAQAYGYKYCPLPGAYKATRQALIDNDLSVKQKLDINDNGDEILITILTHDKSGEFITSSSNLSRKMNQIYQYLIESEKLSNDTKKLGKINFNQIWGATYTYFRRYDYYLILGIIGEDEDTDGDYPNSHNDSNNNSKYSHKVHYIGSNPPPNQKPAQILANILEKNDCDVVEFTKYFSIKSSDLPSVNNAIKNIDDMVSKFKNREIKIYDEEGKKAS